MSEEFVLNESERQRIRQHVNGSYRPRGAAVAALRTIQEHRGYVSDEAIREVAPLVEMTPDELEGLATYYSLIFRRPVGRHVIKVCDSIVCWMLGSESLLQHLSERLGIAPGETTADGEFTLLRICCLGDCDHAPVMMVDDELIRGVTPERIDRVLAGEPASGE